MPAKRREPRAAALQVLKPSAQPEPAAAIRPAPRIYYIPHHLIGLWDALAPHLDRANALGFDTILLPPIFETDDGAPVFTASNHDRAARSVFGDRSFTDALNLVRSACDERRLALFLDLVLDRVSANHPLVEPHAAAFTVRRDAEGRGPIDPRQPQPLKGEAYPRLNDPAAAGPMKSFAVRLIGAGVDAGVAGFRILRPDAAPPSFWRDVLNESRTAGADFFALADIEGLPRAAAKALTGCGFDGFTSSLAWWDGRATWLIEEYEDLRRGAPMIATVEAPFGPRTAVSAEGLDPLQTSRRILALAAATGSGLLMPLGFEYGAKDRLDPRGGDGAFPVTSFVGAPPLSEDVRLATRRANDLAGFCGEMRRLSASGSVVTALLRGTTGDLRTADEALLTLINTSSTQTTTPDPDALLTGSGFGPFTTLENAADPFTPLPPGGVRLARGKRTPAITASSSLERPAPSAAQSPRLVVESLSPAVSGGPFPVKWTINQTVVVEADVLADGHEALAVELQWRALDEHRWSTEKMTLIANDRWRGSFRPEQLGRYEFRVEAWIDRFGGFRTDYAKKLDADVATDLDLQEGLLLIQAAAKRSSASLKTALLAVLTGAKSASAADQRRLLLAPETLDLMAMADDRPFRVASDPPQRLDAERISARFASWYELFPRSLTDDAGRHGRFDDVIQRLPAVRDMGFDVLYFPPIHPIGVKNRKGRNNTLKAGPDEPGSPYAIGSQAGGHDAIHPELGTLEDFRRLVRAAADAGLEIALDFAIQCSPDHPWLKEHPDWFAWRPDGSIRYAENPPKKYEDIVNVDFYATGAVPDLWNTLRDIVLLWVSEGVKTFRVDNPHTKPLPFWEWMIDDVRRAHPDVIFLAEAFTKPKMMYRLAKIGFSQSYTYFTWRHSKEEFVEYLTELTQTAPKDFFRPHFFVNTPDINPYFLQTSGRAGFLIRAALAATLSGLWGLYSGFELLESAPLPGKEEYLDSEKFEIKPRDWGSEPNIIAEISQLNRLRKAHPALQTHLGIEFFSADNPNVLYFGKSLPGQTEMILVAINLDPHHGQDFQIETPFWRLGLEENDPIEVVNLLAGDQFVWRGRHHRLWLDPALPYVLFHIQPERQR